MARNREPEKPVESQSESGEEEEDEEASSEEGVSESEPETEPTQVTKMASSSAPAPASQKKVQTPSAAKPQEQSGSSSDEEDSGSESESESDEPELNVRPISSKPMDDPQKSNYGASKTISKPNAPEPNTPSRSTVTKRPSEERQTDAKDSKKAKKKPEPETSEKKSNDDSKKLLFQRLWSEDDEIAVLKGMIDYACKKKADPVADLNAFHDFIRQNLHVDVTKTQLQDKIRRLRKKYENNRSKEKEGKERTFSKPHEQKAYELSKNIWGNEAGKENGSEKVLGSPKAIGSAVRKTPGRRANAVDIEGVKDAKSAEVLSSDGDKLALATLLDSDGASVEERILAIGAELYAVGKGLEGEKEWRRLRLEEFQLHLRRLEVRVAQTKLVLDVLKCADH